MNNAFDFCYGNSLPQNPLVLITDQNMPFPMVVGMDSTVNYLDVQ